MGKFVFDGPFGRIVRGICLAGLVVGSVASPAAAHVQAEPREAPAGRLTRIDFKVPHGCHGSPTTKLTVRIPDGVLAVKPLAKPGWEIGSLEEELAAPVSVYTMTVTKQVREVSWEGGSLPDRKESVFGMNLRLPDRPGTTLYFPSVQECVEGTHRWIEIPRAGRDTRDLDEPAPALRLVEAVPAARRASREPGRNPLPLVAPLVTVGLLGLAAGTSALRRGRK